MQGATVGGVRMTLRVEGLLILIAALYFYPQTGYSWSTFAWFFLLPDLSFFGYLFGPRAGAISYNTAHSYIGALLCFLLSWHFFPDSALQCASVIWIAHIGFDRSLGYGLKYTQGFSYTHLGRIGKAARDTFATPAQPDNSSGA